MFVPFEQEARTDFKPYCEQLSFAVTTFRKLRDSYPVRTNLPAIANSVPFEKKAVRSQSSSG